MKTKKTAALSRFSCARAALRLSASRTMRHALPLAASCVAAAWLAACAMPYHADASAPAPDPFNPAATQLLDDTHWQLTGWLRANGAVAHVVPQAPAGDAHGAGGAHGSAPSATDANATNDASEARRNVKTVFLAGPDATNTNGINRAGGANDAGNAITLDLSTASGQRRVSGFSGCNRYTGTYTLKNGLLSFGPLAGTRMACLGAGGDIERAYLDALAHVARSGVQMRAPEQLLLVLGNGERLTFARR